MPVPRWRRLNQGLHRATHRALPFALYLAQVRGTITTDQAKAAVKELTLIPGKLEQILTHDEACDDLAKTYVRAQDFFFLGRGIHYPIALEGALKLKEISYIHAEGYPAGEMKHGPNALIDENLPVVIIATRDENSPQSMLRYEKTMSNLKEVKARSGIVIALATMATKRSPKKPITCSSFRPLPKSFPRSWKSSRCNCLRITSRSAAVATSISREIWRSQ